MSRGHTRSYYFFLLLATGICYGCSKDRFLDKKPNTQLVIPTTIPDFQALLDYQTVMQETPELGELSSDNYYMLYSTWTGLTTKYRNAYIWAKDIYDGQGKVPDYNIPYQQVFYANVVLDEAPKVTVNESNRQDWNRAVGMAHFIRGYAFYNLTQLFAPVYDPGTASMDDGIALRLNSNVNKPSQKAKVKDNYDQIIKDLKQADSLLPEDVPTANLNRPCKAAARAMLARVYLSMRDYSQAATIANSSLQLYSTLMDYKGLTNFIQNREILYYSVLISSSEVLVGGGFKTVCVIDSTLYASYIPGDLRRTLFFRNSSPTGPHYLRLNYSGASFCFSGLAVDEVVLIRAECAARSGNKDSALNDLNNLLQHRWVSKDSIPFVPIKASSAEAALDSVLMERRKELAFRGLRWTDLRRLNKENANISVTHGLNGQLYHLSPGSPNYKFYLPPDVVSPNSPMTNDSTRVQINPG